MRIPAGHPEGYLEAFAQIYSDAADVIQNKENKEDLLKLLPNIDDGLHIMKFINASVNSSNNNSAWTDLSTIKWLIFSIKQGNITICIFCILMLTIIILLKINIKLNQYSRSCLLYTSPSPRD